MILLYYIILYVYHNILSCYIILYYIIIYCHIIQYYNISSDYTILCYTILYYITLYYIILFYINNHIILYHIVYIYINIMIHPVVEIPNSWLKTQKKEQVVSPLKYISGIWSMKTR